jgi:hypothetical protein
MTDAQKVVLQNRFEICPQCNYKDGFHIILIEDPDAGRAEMKFQLKCPNCSTIYDLNLYCSIKK